MLRHWRYCLTWFESCWERELLPFVGIEKPIPGLKFIPLQIGVNIFVELELDFSQQLVTVI